MRRKVAFVDLGRDIFDRHGIYALSSILASHQINVSYISGSTHSKIIDAVLDLGPELVMYSSFSTALAEYSNFDKALKRRASIMSIIGGPGVTFNPQQLFETSINAGCVGEGDIALPEFILSNFSKHKNVYLNDGEIPDTYYPFSNLDSMPFPDRDLVYSKDSTRRDNPTKTFISGRGCPFMCTYCFNHTYNTMFKGCGPTIRKKSVDYVLDEIALVRNKYPLKNVAFNDDTFIVDSKWFFEFAERFSSRFDLTYSCNIRANLMTEDIARALADSRCSAVNWSIESGDKDLRNTLLKRNMSDEQIRFAAAMLNKYKLVHRIGNVIGLPGETISQVQKTIELNIECRPNLALANIFVPFPGLELTQKAIDGGYYTPLPDDQLPSNYFTKSVLKLDDSTNILLQKTLFLFLFFVAYPKTYSSKALRGFLYSLPRAALRVAYEFFYAYKLKNMYNVSGNFAYTAKAVFRHLKSLLFH